MLEKLLPKMVNVQNITTEIFKALDVSFCKDCEIFRSMLTRFIKFRLHVFGKQISSKVPLSDGYASKSLARHNQIP